MGSPQFFRTGKWPFTWYISTYIHTPSHIHTHPYIHTSIHTHSRCTLDPFFHQHTHIPPPTHTYTLSRHFSIHNLHAHFFPEKIVAQHRRRQEPVPGVLQAVGHRHLWACRACDGGQLGYPLLPHSPGTKRTLTLTLTFFDCLQP